MCKTLFIMKLCDLKYVWVKKLGHEAWNGLRKQRAYIFVSDCIERRGDQEQVVVNILVNEISKHCWVQDTANVWK
jgi:hypothetical protein